MIPKLSTIDQECAELLQSLVDVCKSPPETPTMSFNIDLFSKYLKDHPEGEVLIGYISYGFHPWLKDMRQRKPCKQVANMVTTKRELKTILERMLKEAKEGYIAPAKKSHGKHDRDQGCPTWFFFNKSHNLHQHFNRQREVQNAFNAKH